MYGPLRSRRGASFVEIGLGPPTPPLKLRPSYLLTLLSAFQEMRLYFLSPLISDDDAALFHERYISCRTCITQAAGEEGEKEGGSFSVFSLSVMPINTHRGGVR